jgi:hypothetical protein
MRTLWKARYLRIAGLAGAAIAVTASAAGMSFGFNRPPAAPSEHTNLTAVDASSSSTACSDFMQHFAVNIGKTQAQINAAFQKSIADTLADEVKSGQLTQAQADAMKAKLANQTPCTLPSTAGHGDKSGLAAYMQQYMAASAAALGISATQLTADLKAGQSLSQVAAAQHVSEADFRTKLIANLKPTLDQAVTDKKITAAQEQTIVSRLQTGPLPLWNAPVKHPKPAAPASPAASPA